MTTPPLTVISPPADTGQPSGNPTPAGVAVVSSDHSRPALRNSVVITRVASNGVLIIGRSPEAFDKAGQALAQLLWEVGNA